MSNQFVVRELPQMRPHVAKLVSRSSPFQLPGKLLVTELWLEVPLDYANPDGKAIKLFGRAATRYERPIVDPAPDDAKSAHKPYLVFLQGGPGFGNPAPDDSPLTRHMLDRGYELLLLDYRGVGYSCPVTPESLSLVGGPEEQADYLKFFRADNIVRDCEAVRRCLTRDYPPEKQKWSIWGQSFGGMTSLTYLSFHPDGLRESFITGGLGALDQSPDQVYRLTYNKVMDRNLAYYKKYPGDVATVKAVARKIHETQGGVPLPAGGTLTVPMLMTLGLSFGAHGGLDHVHNLILKMKGDLDQFGLFTRPTLNTLEQDLSFDTAPIYSLLHEPCWIYGPGIAANWAAERVGKKLPAYQWLCPDWAGPQQMDDHEPLYFSGEMVYPFFFDTYGGLKPLKETAQLLAEYDQWPPLYDTEQLKKNEIPVYAACYEDMYVDTGTARITASKIKGIKVFETNVLYHSALRHRSDDVFQELLRLRDDTID